MTTPDLTSEVAALKLDSAHETAPPATSTSTSPTPVQIEAAKGEETAEETAERAKRTYVPPSTRPPKPDGPKVSDPFQFGSRFLTPDDDPMEFNAWDHVEIDDDYRRFIAEQLEKQRAKPVSDFDKQRFNSEPAKWWDKFYQNNRENFFKDRKWLQQEFPILIEATSPTAPPTVVVELGCGAGNTLFPILAQNQNEKFHIHGCDYSAQAVELVKNHDMFKEYAPKGNVAASVYDLSAPDTLPEGIEPGTVDIVAMVFVFSALAPTQWIHAIRNIRRMMKPGGHVLLRDYGRNDLAQVRFKASRYLEENFYIRGDGTRVYFFELDELEKMFTGKSEGECRVVGDEIEDDGFGGFVKKHLAVDKRMLVNRKRQLKMHRRWVQAVFQKE